MTDEIIKPGKYVALTYAIVDEKGEVLEQHDVPGAVCDGSTNKVSCPITESLCPATKPDQTSPILTIHPT